MVLYQPTGIPMSKRFFPALQPIIGEHQYGQAKRKYSDLYANFDLPDNPKLKWHLVEGILPGLALYQILRENGESQTSALGIIDQIFEKLFSNKLAQMKKLGNIPFIYPLLRAFIKTAMRQYPRDGWNLEWVQNDKNAIRFHMKSCYYFDILVRLGAPELTASFCKVDDFIYGNMSPYVKWSRSMTIGRGNTHCDFEFSPGSKLD